MFTIIGFIGGTFLPEIKYSAEIEDAKKMCDKYPAYRNDANCSGYHRLLALHFNYDSFIPKQTKLINNIYKNLTTQPVYDCDPIKDEIMLKETYFNKCSILNSRKAIFLSSIITLFHQMKKIDPSYWDNAIRRKNGGHDAYRLKPWSNEECIKVCKTLPKRMRVAGGHSSTHGEFALSVTGETIYPLNCKWRCESRKEISQLLIKYGKWGCEDIKISKKDGSGTLVDQSNVCSYYVGQLINSGHPKKASKIYERIKLLDYKFKQWKKNGVPLFYNVHPHKN